MPGIRLVNLNKRAAFSYFSKKEPVFLKKADSEPWIRPKK